MKKSVREMGTIERKRHSLSVRSALGIQLLALIVGVTVLVAGFLLYFAGILYEYSDNNAKLAKAESLMLDPDATKVKIEEIMKIYDSIPEEEKGDGTDPAYNQQFDGVIDDEFEDIQRRLSIMKEEIGLRNAFVVAIDEPHNRMVYLIDSDPNPETVCHPGTWDEYTSEEIDILLHGTKAGRMQKKLGLDTKHQATLTNTPKYGFRCTGGATLYEDGNYTYMVCLDEKLDHMVTVSKAFLVQYVILLFIVVILIGVIALLFIRRMMIKPLTSMADAARAYTKDKQNNITISNHFRNLEIRKGDEIEDLKLTMEEMEDSLTEYIENLTAITAEKERISTELTLASRIQQDVLPTDFPERDDFDICAVMDPAKQIGGDFYDFFMIDDDHVGLIIADVSDKGIPAALFMMVSKTILDNRLMELQSPALALEQANSAICQNNKEEMFVTVWLGILELSTGKLIAANAGHEKPVMIDPDGHAALVNDKHGFVVGGLENSKYKDYELQMEPGSKLLLYTDGVTDATADNHTTFGTDGLITAIAGVKYDSAKEVLRSVRVAVDDFVGEAEQFDDLTMLCVHYKGKK